VNSSITDVNFKHELSLPQHEPGERYDELVFFFDPPWGGIDYQEKDKMTFEDFKPYPMREALTNAFRLTMNVMLKLPKNQDVN
jgi:hypothetical protein